MKATPEHHLLDAGIDEQALTDYRKGISGHERLSRSLLRANQPRLSKAWRNGHLQMYELMEHLDRLSDEGDAQILLLIARIEAKEFSSLGRPRPGQEVTIPHLAKLHATIDVADDLGEGDPDYTLEPGNPDIAVIRNQQRAAMAERKRAKVSKKKASKKKSTKKKSTKKKSSR